MVREVSASLQAHLDSGATTLSWCWQIKRTDGLMLGFTDHDEDISLQGVTYFAESGMEATDMVGDIGLSVDNLDVQGAISSETITESDIAKGLYDNAEVKILRVNWKNPTDNIVMRIGNIGEIRRTHKMFVAEVRGKAHTTQQARGRVFQATCEARLGDSYCGVNLEDIANFRLCTVTAVIDSKTFICSGMSDVLSGRYEAGFIDWITGNNVGSSLEILSQKLQGTETTIKSWQSFPSPIVVGDSLKARIGCNKSASTCRDKFSNIKNFKGFPSMPGNDFIVATVTRNDPNNDGEVR